MIAKYPHQSLTVMFYVERRECINSKPDCSGGEHAGKTVCSGQTPHDLNGKSCRDTNKSTKKHEAARREDDGRSGGRGGRASGRVEVPLGQLGGVRGTRASPIQSTNSKSSGKLNFKLA